MSATRETRNAWNANANPWPTDAQWASYSGLVPLDYTAKDEAVAVWVVTPELWGRDDPESFERFDFLEWVIERARTHFECAACAYEARQNNAPDADAWPDLPREAHSCEM